MSKKLFGKLFVILLVAGLLFAAAPTMQAKAATSVTTEADLIAALGTAETEIILGDNIALANELVITRAVTIDLNGKTLSKPATDLIDRVFHVQAGGNLTVNATGGGSVSSPDTADGRAFEMLADASATMTINGGAFTAGFRNIVNQTNTLIVNGGTIHGVDMGIAVRGNRTTTEVKTTTLTVNGGTISSGDYPAVHVAGYGATFNLVGGTLTGVGGRTGAPVLMGNGSSADWGTVINISGGLINALGGTGISQPQKGVINISGGQILANTGIEIKSGTLNMTGGTIVANGAKVDPPAHGEDGTALSGDGIFVVTRTGYDWPINVNLTGGSISSADAWAVREFLHATVSESKSVTIINGTTLSGGALLLKPVVNVTKSLAYTTIQAAITAASAGDTITVADGTYTMASEGYVPSTDTLKGMIEVKKPITIIAAADGNSTRPVIDATSTTSETPSVFKLRPSNFVGGVLRIEGFEIKGNVATGTAMIGDFCGADDGYTSLEPGKVVINNNVFTGTMGGINFWGNTACADGKAPRLENFEITNNQFTGLVAADGYPGYGILLERLSTWAEAKNAFAGVVSGNTFTNIASGGTGANQQGVAILVNMPQDPVEVGSSNVSIQNNTVGTGVAAGVGVFTADASAAKVEINKFVNGGIGVSNAAAAGSLDASPNWWGSIAGPAAGTFVGTAEYAPWCGDAECSFLVYPLLSTGLQASIDATPDGGTLYVPAGTYTDGDVDGYTVGGKTIILGDGVIIQNSSPCFTVTGSYTTITTESIGGATCVPTFTTGEDYGSSGIDVNGGLSNIVIEGIYFDTDQVLEALGVISFNGAVSDVLVNDNYFHVSSSIVYDGIIFAQQPAGLVEIKGNLFEMPNMYGCAVNNFYGTSTIDAQFNSFGSMDGHPASVPGVRVCTNVDYSNFTHADVYLESSATPWANQEVVGQEFTLTVKANLTKVTGAKFTLKYNPALVNLDAASLENLSGFSAAGLNLFEVDETLGLITFNANAYPAITGAEYALFSADFTASAVGAALFEVDALSDEFAMFPGYASSSNVYGYTLLPVSVDLIELPTVASTFGDSYYLVGEARDFTMTVTNFDTAYAAPELRITIPTGLTLKYGGVDYTGTLVVDLENLAVGEEVIIDLTATFTAPFNTTAAVLGVKLVDALPTEEELVNTSFSANAYTKPSVTIGSDPYFLVGVPGDFSVTIDNPPTGRNYGDTIVFDIVIANHAVADISAVSCSMGGFTWNLIGTLVSDGAGNVKARIVGDNGYFTVPADFHPVIACSITYATPGTYEVSGYMVEAIPTPERIVSDSYSATTQVYIQPVITSTDLDGPFQAGLAQGVTLTITNPSPIPEPFDLVFTLPDGTTILYNGVTYTCSSTGCPAIPLVAGAVPGDIGFTITFPVGFVGGTADISVSLYDRDTVGAPSPLATLNVPAVVVYANVASVTGTVSMQGRTTRAGVLFTLAGSFDTYTATSINTLSNNVSFTNLASGVYAITVEQARYLDITITHGAKIDLATLQAIVNLELRAGDANDDNYINGGDASIVGGQYGTGTIADQGDINFDNKVNIQDLALVGGNFDFQSANPTHPTLPYAYGTWMK